MSKSPLLGAFCAVVISIIILPSHAALVGVLPATPGGTDWQAVYDTDQNITWLANANLASSNTFGVGGISPAGDMNWHIANSWIDAMNADGGTG